MNIKINDDECPKEQLLGLIERNKIQAIIFIRNIVNIGLKDAKEIVDNLDHNPNYYDNITIKKITKDFIENEQMIVDVKNDDNKGPSINEERKKGSHFIKRNNSSRGLIIFGLFFLIVLLVYFLTKGL